MMIFLLQKVKAGVYKYIHVTVYIMNEDNDFCCRILLQHFLIIYIPVYHKKIHICNRFEQK